MAPQPHQSPRPAWQISSRFAALLFGYLRGAGIDPGTLYPPTRVAAIEAADLPVRMPLSEWLTMMEAAMVSTGDPDLALKIGTATKFGRLGVFGYVMMSCATVEEAMLRSERYMRLTHDLGLPRMVRTAGVVETLLEWPDDSPPPPFLVQFRLATRVAAIRWMAGRPELKMDADFQFPRPRDTSSYVKVFGGKLRFGRAHNKLIQPEAQLRLPIVMADPDMQRMACAQAEAMLGALAGEPEFVRQLKTTLLQGLSAGRTSLMAASRSLNVSTRTLHRRLAEHGRSFRELIDEVRRTSAEALLRDPSITIAEVALLVGYTEQSSFQQAFKQWTGLTPGAFRTRACAPRR